MSRLLRKLGAIVCVAALASAVSACGGGSGGGSSTSANETGAQAQGQAESKPQQAAQAPSGSQKENGAQSKDATKAGESKGGKSKSGKVPGDTSASFTPKSHSDSGGGAAQFETKGGDNSIQEFGSEGSGSEFEQAAAALHGYLDARAAKAWEAACSYMAEGTQKMLEQFGSAAPNGGKGTGCATILAALSGGVPQSALDEAAVADVGSLRVEGDRGFLLYHGARKQGYIMPMAREGDEWKVGAIAGSAVL